MINFLKRFNSYQKTRFPLVILIVSLFPVTLSTAAVTIGKPSVVQVLGALSISVLYLLHIRIIDEVRDLFHDNHHHRLRPVQSGLISIGELQKIDIVVVLILLVIALFNNIYCFIIVVCMLSYSYFAGKDFFNGKILREHFFVYNAINIMQMIFLQVFAYSYYAGLIKFSLVIVLHFMFTSTGSIIFEFVRKIKIPGEDGTGKDTYSYHVGFNNAIFFYCTLVIFNGFLFYLLLISIAHGSGYMLLIIVSLFILIAFGLFHMTKKRLFSEQLMQLSILFVYVIFNLVIFVIANNKS